MACPEYDTLLGFVEGRVDEATRATIQEHIDSCGDCFASVVALMESLEDTSQEESGLGFDDTLGFTQTLDKGFDLPLSNLREGTGAVMSKLGSPGTDFDHFRVIRTLGRGGMGEVYLARDMKLGRKVALKVIKPGLLGSDELIDRFLFEAKTTARFNHPHIVTIYGVGQVEGMPYVALEYLEGQDLRTRIHSQAPSHHEALRIMLAVSEAIEEAHKHDILHRDLKPANVLIPTDGRVRVVDFGLALALQSPSAGDQGEDSDLENRVHDTSKNRLVGTPAYMSPEQWRGEECTSATDIWAVGLMLFELCTGHPPIVANSSAELRKAVIAPEPIETAEALRDAPDGIGALIDLCLSKDPQRRPNAGQVVEQLRELLYDGRRMTVEGESPFRGLLPFTERHAHWFFGRDVEISHCVEHLRHAPMVAVVGASGAGKSSFVQAGVIPRLREISPWVVLRLRPGRHPIRRLASKIISGLMGETGTRPPISSHGESRVESPAPVPLANAVDTLSEKLAANPGQLALSLMELANARDSMVLLLVDQMEEVFTQTAYDEEMRSFLNAICAAGDDASGPVRVMLTLRDDFLGHLAHGTANAKNILQDVMVLKSPNRDSLRDVITKPLDMVGFQYEDVSIVDSMLDAVGPDGGLPLLQFTARMLWDKRDVKSREIKKAHYIEIGGVQGALAQHAESVLKRFTAQELTVARTLFLRMVTPERTRRTRSRSALIDGLQEPGDRVLNQLTQSRLVSARRTEDMDEQDAVYEFAHESLLNEWPTLSRWLDENREEIVFLNEVEQAADLWNKRGRRSAELWTGDALRNAIGAKSRATTPIPQVVEEFIEQGAKRDAQIRLRRRFWSISLPLILAVVSLIFAFQKYEADYQRDAAQNQQEQAYLQQEQALKSRALAEQQRVEALLENARGALERKRPLEARAKLRMAMEQATRDIPAMRGLWWQLTQDPLVWTHNLGTVLYEAKWSPDGKWIAVGTQDRTLYLFDSATKASRILRDPRDQIHGLAFSPESKLLISGDSSGYLYVHDASSGQLLHEWQGHQGRISDVAYHPTQGLIVSAGDDGFIRIWEPDTQREIHSLAFKTQDICFDGRGELLAAGHSDRVGLWSVEDWKPVDLGENKPFGVRVAFFSKDNHLATGTRFGKVHLWSSVDGALIREMGDDGKPVNVLITSPESPYLLSGHSKFIKVWDGLSHQEKGIVQAESTLDAAFSPDGQQVVTGGSDSILHVWKIDRIGAPKTTSSHTPLTATIFSADGKSILTSSVDGVAAFWDTARGTTTGGLRDQPEGLRANLSPDGAHAIWAGWSGALHMHELPSTRRKFVVQAHLRAIVSLEFNPSSTAIVTGSDDGHAKIWDLEGTLVQDIHTGRGPVLAVVFSPDGQQVASTSPSGVSIWDVKTGEELQFAKGPKGYAYALDWSPDGTMLAFGTRGSRPWVWELTNGSAPREINAPGRMNGLVFHPTKNWLGMACVDNVARVVDLDGRVIGTYLGHPTEVNVVDFSPDGNLITSAGDDGRVRTWYVETAEPYWKTIGVLSHPLRILTQRGWETADGNPSQSPEPTTLWDEAKKSSIAVESADGTLLCLLDNKRRLTVWNVSANTKLATQQGVGRVISSKEGCLARHGEQVTLYTRQSGARALEFESTAQLIGSGEEHLQVVTGENILLFDKTGEPIGARERTEGLSAITSVTGPGMQDLLAAGYQDGVIELSPLHLGEMGARNTLQGCPNSQVTLLLAGPPGTAIAGFEDGTIGLWGLRDGILIRKTRLHGAIQHGVLRDEQFVAATDLGESLAWDLSPFYTPPCENLQAVWDEVPVVWQRGQASHQSPPAQHACFPEAK